MLTINEDFNSLDAALPKAARVLSEVGDVRVFHDEYGLRHPFGAYNISLEAIGKRVSRVIEATNALQSGAWVSDRSAAGEALLEAMDHLLDAAMEHLDVCHGIASSFISSTDDRRRKEVYGHLKREIEPYRRHIGAVANYIKHKQGRLRLVEFSWPNNRCLGYFVEGPGESGIVGPAKEIHADSNSAFSFNRDIRFHLCAIFAIGARLASVLHSIDRRLVPASHPVIETRDTAWKKALQLAANLPLTFFPDEVLKPVPDIRLTSGRLVVSAPATKARILAPPQGAQVFLTLSGDGATRSFRLPYHQGA